MRFARVGDARPGGNEGFSFIELIIIIAVIGVISALAIPGLTGSRRSSNGAAAVEATRLFHSTEVTYQAGVGNSSFGSAPNLFETGFIDAVLANAAGVDTGHARPCFPTPCADSPAGGRASGYIFVLELSRDPNGRSHFKITATPAAPNRSGDETFSMDDASEVVHVSCPPGKIFNPVTGACEPDDNVLTLKALDTIRALDSLSGGVALPVARQLAQSPAFVQAALRLMDDDGDGLLTFDEVLGGNFMKIARMLRRDADGIGHHPGSLGRDQVLERVLLGYIGGVRDDLALGIANESLRGVPISQMQGDIGAFFDSVR